MEYCEGSHEKGRDAPASLPFFVIGKDSDIHETEKPNSSPGAGGPRRWRPIAEYPKPIMFGGCVRGKILWINLKMSFVNFIDCIAIFLGRFPEALTKSALGDKTLLTNLETALYCY